MKPTKITVKPLTSGNVAVLFEVEGQKSVRVEMTPELVEDAFSMIAAKCSEARAMAAAVDGLLSKPAVSERD